MNNQVYINKYLFNTFKYDSYHISGNINFYECCIGYILKGSGLFLYNGNNYYAQEGDLLYIAKGTQYYSAWHGTPDIEFYSISYSFFPQHIFSEFEFQIVKNYPSEQFNKLAKCESSLLSLGYFYELLDDIYTMLNPTNKKVINNIQPAIDYIESNYTTPISIEKLAKLCYCSESGLFSKFKKETGVSPIKYKHNILIQRALEILKNTNMSIDDISSSLGFSSTNYFRRIFIKEVGYPPSYFRKS